MQQKIVGSVKITPTEVKDVLRSHSKRQSAFFESELEVCQIVIYPKASRDLEQYIIVEMNNYKETGGNQSGCTFEQLASTIFRRPRQQRTWWKIPDQQK